MRNMSISKLYKSGRNRFVRNILFTVYNNRVANGPFKGMRYIKQAHGSALLPKIIGSYERELHPIINEIAEKGYSLVVDIGSAEGYYAVGLANLYKEKGYKNFKVHAYDINTRAHTALKKLAALNEVQDLIEVSTLCDHKQLSSFNGKKAFVLCDIEGSELDLLDPSKCENLYHMDMLVEVHDGNETYITDELVQRFRDSHTIDLIEFTSRHFKESPWWLLSRSIRQGSVSEGRRKGLKWMYLKVKY